MTTTDSEGRPRGLTLSAYTPVSLDPPLVLVCVQKTSSTYPALFESEHLGINIIANTQRAAVDKFASKADDKFAGLDWHTGPAGSPLIRGSAASIEAEIKERFQAKTHTVFIARVTHWRSRTSTRCFTFTCPGSSTMVPHSRSSEWIPHAGIRARGAGRGHGGEDGADAGPTECVEEGACSCKAEAGGPEQVDAPMAGRLEWTTNSCSNSSPPPPRKVEPVCLRAWPLSMEAVEPGMSRRRHRVRKDSTPPCVARSTRTRKQGRQLPGPVSGHAPPTRPVPSPRTTRPATAAEASFSRHQPPPI
ncbi:flavin reductase family protein [Arthrobacter crystallopoietes]|uniref:flavin reductase family protein n=1 Tax=Crystallibacter crystallopoietes TaxID=37928 RepID=UPI001FCD35EE|nr:flavin reductase family protein [Arthrobacter crystallopoietes]